MLLGTPGTVAPYLFGETFLRNNFEAKPFEETGLSGKGEKMPFDGRTFLRQFVNDETDEQTTDPLPVKRLRNNKRTNLKKIRTEIPDGNTSADVSFAESNAEIADKSKDILPTAAQDNTFERVGFEEIENSRNIIGCRTTDKKIPVHSEKSLSLVAIRGGCGDFFLFRGIFFLKISDQTEFFIPLTAQFFARKFAQ